MSLWGKTDTAASAPKSSPASDNTKLFFVDTTEAAVASNRAKGLKTPGWNKFETYVDANGKTRYRAETLIPMKVTAVAAGDAGMTGNTTIEDATVADV
jgi:hypothetical protein